MILTQPPPTFLLDVTLFTVFFFGTRPLWFFQGWVVVFDMVKSAIWKRLFAGTLPENKNLFAGTLPANKNLFAETIPANKNLFAETIPANKTYLPEHLK